MLDVTVKTLDGKNRAFSVPDDMSIKDFKKKIAESIEISPETQRLIFQGRVLQDDKKMMDYDINGKTLHVVQRPPPLAGQSQATGSPSSTGSSQESGGRIGMDTTGVVVSSFTLPPDMANTTNVQTVVQQALSGFGSMGRNARVHTTMAPDGSTMDVRINLDAPNRAPMQSESQNRINQARRMLTAASRIIDRLDNPDASPNSDSSPREEPTASPATDNASASSGAQSGRNASERPARIPDPAPPVLGELLQEVFTINSRFQPHFEEYQRLLQNDTNFGADSLSARRAQRLADYVSDVLHLISHAYHNISDIMLDAQQTPPRRLHANAPQHLHLHHPTYVHATPVQTHINVSRIVPHPQTTGAAPTTSADRTPAAAATPGVSTSGVNTSASNNLSTSVSATTSQHDQTPLNALPNMVAAQLAGLLNLNQPASTTAQSTPRTNAQTGGTNTSQPGTVPPFLPPFLPPELLQNMMQAAAGVHANMPANIQIQQGPNHAVIVTRAPVLSTAALPMPVFSVVPNSAPPANTSSTSGRQTGESAAQADRPAESDPAASGGGPTSSAPAASGSAAGRQQQQTTGGDASRTSHPPRLRRVPIDPFLPCQSRFFMGRTVTGQQPIEEVLHQRITSVIDSVLPNYLQPDDDVENTTNNAMTDRDQSSTTRPQDADLQSFMGQLQNILQQGRSATGQQQQQQQQETTSGEVFAELVQGIGTYLSQAADGEQSTDTIADFMRQLGENYNIEQSEGLLGDLCSCLSRHLTFVDLMSVIFGNAAPLRSARDALREFVVTAVLDGAEPTEDVIVASLNRLQARMQPDIDEACAGAEVRDDIDFNATVSALIQHRLSAMVRLILHTPEDVTFENELLRQARLLLHEFVVLGQSCLTGGMDDTIRLAQNRVRSIVGDVNPLIMQWMMTMSSQQIRQLVPSSLASADSVAHYVVRRQQPMAADGSSPSSDGSFMSVDEETTTASAAAAASGAAAASAAEKAPKPAAADVDDVVGTEEPEDQTRPVIPPEVASRLAPPPQPEDDDNVMVILGSEEWHHPLPSEWVPIIARDVQRQSHQPPQPAFSEAYVSGMPAKRRKLESTEKVEEGHTKHVA